MYRHANMIIENAVSNWIPFSNNTRIGYVATLIMLYGPRNCSIAVVDDCHS